ncbi:L-aspartate oxidase [Aminipila sp.]|uniref:L-aspartate oxidase n=1 Tax=Aminipila sp. TaxID=2060095 RepID=UPI002898BD0E|nr:L-aspartate oxidase [Aminipila sp.]
MTKLNTNIKTDIVIVGSGVSGLFCALNLPKDKNILIITKDALENSDSYLAQGGICMMRNEADYQSFFNDTLHAGHYENNKESVNIMIRSSQEIIRDLVNYDVEFERDGQNFIFTKEGAHSIPRILFHQDITGKEITSKLLRQVKALDNVEILEYVTMLDILEDKNQCHGIICKTKNGELITIEAKYTVWASGGIGGLFKHSTNFNHLTGDALGIALKHHIGLQNIDYIQIHPTTLYTSKSGRSFLISESVRGEGAMLLNAKMERFVDELLPRDVVTKEIYKQMEIDHTPHVWLSMLPIAQDIIMKHFPNIYEYCLNEGYDITKECIPVVPAQHYFMGGIHVDKYSKTSMHRLYAVGETSCNGVHGSNRLASNSLLESLVFAKRAAKHISKKILQHSPISPLITPASESLTARLIENLDVNFYMNDQRLLNQYKHNILNEIERMRKSHEQYLYETKCR